MRKIIMTLAVLAVVLTGCIQTESPPVSVTPPDGTNFTVAYSTELGTLNYLVTNMVSEMEVAVNVTSGLVEHNSYGVLVPSLAKSWQVSENGLVYTLMLREGQKWYTWDGQEYAETTAQDFVDAVKYVLNPENKHTGVHVRNTLKNANAYYLSKLNPSIPDMDFAEVGIKALDRYVVEYTLQEVTPWFLSLLTHPHYRPVNGSFLAEVGESFGSGHTTLLYNGPYILEELSPRNVRRLVKNANYWNSDNVHIGRVTYRFAGNEPFLTLFSRGEASTAAIPVGMLENWNADPGRAAMVLPGDVNWMWNFWFAFNFDPQFPKEYEPDNWRKAVMNLNFRKAIFHGLDRTAAQEARGLLQPEQSLKNSFSSPGLFSVEGSDYTMLPALKEFTITDPFNADLARGYVAKTMEELAEEVAFPVKVKWVYNTSSHDGSVLAETIKDQLESLLGKDFIEVIPVGYMAQGYLDNTRRRGNYAMQEVNYGATYSDPLAFTAPYQAGESSWTDIFLVVGDEYQRLHDRANAERTDLYQRYTLFAEAEAFLLENAIGIPFSGRINPNQVTYMQPFTRPYNPLGLCGYSYKYAVMNPEPVTYDEYIALQAQWETERQRALAETGQ